MKIRYQLHMDDLIAFQVNHMKTCPKSLKTRARNRVLIPVIYATFALSWVYFSPAHWLEVLIVLTFATLWASFYPRVWEQRLHKRLKKTFKKQGKTAPEGVQELTLQNDGFIAKNNTKEGFIAWTQIQKYVHTEHYLFLYLSSDDAIIIPQKNLECDDSWNAFCQFIHNKLESKARAGVIKSAG